MRVVAGRLRGRALSAPPGDATRPTGARVKEALFSILGDMSGLRVLDLYAGSGALGIEALSRGAARAVFVESARPALACLRGNLSQLQLDTVAISLPLRVESALAQLKRHGPFELVLCDPPWRDVLAAQRELEALAGSGLFTAGARIVLEHAAKDALPAAQAGSGLQMCDERRWGDTAISFFEFCEPADVPGSGEGPTSGSGDLGP